jgi:uncharacterized protein YecT (DUF1311 family)
MFLGRDSVCESPLVRFFTGSALFAALFVGSTLGAFAERSPSQPWVDDTIQTSLDACLHGAAQSGKTRSIENCYTVAENHYDLAVDAAYLAALKHLDAVSAARLRQTQATWLAYRKDVYNLTSAPWSGDRGTIVGSQMSQSEIIAQKARLLEIDLVWPGFAEGDSPLEIGTQNSK